MTTQQQRNLKLMCGCTGACGRQLETVEEEKTKKGAPMDVNKYRRCNPNPILCSS